MLHTINQSELTQENVAFVFDNVNTIDATYKFETASPENSLKVTNYTVELI